MNAQEFYHKFINEVVENNKTDNGKTYFDIYHKNTGSDFTKLINPIIKRIIESGIDEESGKNYISQNEYFKVDVIGYIDRKEEMQNAAQTENINMNSYFWDLKIAVEHENNAKDWFDEAIKLIYLKCPLKVIIGYSPCDKREEDLKKLNFLATFMKKINAFQADKDSYLIILGNSASRHDYDKFDYIGYVYNWSIEEFEKIN